MQEGKTRHTVQKRHDHGALIEALVVRPPGLQYGARHIKRLGRLTLGEALGLQTARPLTQLSACNAIPALLALLVASLRLLDYCAHSDLLVPLFAYVDTMAKDGEVACWFQPFVVSSYGLSGAVSESKWPTR
jgi:hypothetical protein